MRCLALKRMNHPSELPNGGASGCISEIICFAQARNHHPFTFRPFFRSSLYLYTHCRASSPSLGVVQSFGTPRVCVPCCCLGSALRLESIVRCSSCSERIFCWFGINSFHCQSRTSQPSASLPSCNFFASPLERAVPSNVSCSCSAMSLHHAHDDKNVCQSFKVYHEHGP